MLSRRAGLKPGLLALPLTPRKKGVGMPAAYPDEVLPANLCASSKPYRMAWITI